MIFSVCFHDMRSDKSPRNTNSVTCGRLEDEDCACITSTKFAKQHWITLCHVPGLGFEIPQQSFVDFSWHSRHAHDIVKRI